MGGRWRVPVAVVAAALLLATTPPGSTTHAAQRDQVGRPLAGEPPAIEHGGALKIKAESLGDLRAWDARVDRLLETGELRLRQEREDALVPGRSHQRFDQYYRGVRVYGADVSRQLARSQAVSIFGSLYAGIQLDTVPALEATAAAAAVSRAAGRSVGPSHVPELVVLPRGNGAFALAYRARVMTPTGVWMYFLDANSGAVLLKRNDTESTVGLGVGVLGDQKKISTRDYSGRFLAWDQLRPPSIITVDMNGNLERLQDYFNGLTSLSIVDIASSFDDNNWTDGAVVDAHVYAGFTYDYYYKRFGRHGLDNQDLGIISIVHPVRRADVAAAPADVVGTYYLNAFYAGNGIMVYGEGLPPNETAGGQHWNYLSGALDVVAHELTHGVTDYSSQLIYENESGALNESFSDMMGTSVEFFEQNFGAGSMKADYIIGEDVITPRGLRSMANPAAFGGPDHYSKRYIGTEDNGGVHVNSGIANQVYYLAIVGGTNRTSGLAVQGVGEANREQVEKVMYRAFTQLMPSDATFSVARAATLQAARDLYGEGSGVERTLAQAWTAVGVN